MHLLASVPCRVSGSLRADMTIRPRAGGLFLLRPEAVIPPFYAAENYFGVGSVLLFVSSAPTRSPRVHRARRGYRVSQPSLASLSLVHFSKTSNIGLFIFSSFSLFNTSFLLTRVSLTVSFGLVQSISISLLRAGLSLYRSSFLASVAGYHHYLQTRPCYD